MAKGPMGRLDYGPLLLDLFIRLSVLVISVGGVCVQNGITYNHNAVWQPDPCTVCMCDEPVPLCEPISCADPGCDYSKGEKLELVPGRCCPICSYFRASCDVRGQSIPHDTEWNPSTCMTCRCDDGIVHCTNATCPKALCRPGEVTQILPGQCCQRCIPAGRPCMDNTGLRRPDGDEWSPLSCVKCVCRNGHTRCMPAECPELRCAEGVKRVHESGQCCPTCAEHICEQENQSYKDGQVWNPDPCTTCTCQAGRIVCRSLECDDNITCSQSQLLVRQAGQCCPVCVAREGRCQEADGVIRYHTEIWQVGPCEFCTCNHGHISCTVSTCSRSFCGQNEVMINKADQCCPICERPKVCKVEDRVYQDGQTWDPDSCSVCSCHAGQATCYRRTCPVCPAGTSRIMSSRTSGDGECCGKCEKARCRAECQICSPSDPRQCKQCKDDSKLLQDGRCVDQCRNGFYPREDNSCHACHENCHTCFDKTADHCLTCPPAYLLLDGQCVRRCGRGYFTGDGHCIKCHPTCSACQGPRQDQCVACALTGQVLMRGRCIDECGPRFYLQGQECEACPITCRHCVVDAPECSSCPPGRFFHQFQCLPTCNRGFYRTNQYVCQACHPSCLECNGPDETDCTACHYGPPTSEGKCRDSSKCRKGQYLNSDLICMDCAPGCTRCHPNPTGISSLCSACLNVNLLPSGSGCNANCMQGMYLRYNICYACDDKCEQCSGPGQCSKCYLPFLLSEGQCVMACGPRKLMSEDSVCGDCPRSCLQCSDEVTCLLCESGTYLRDGHCVTSCGSGFIPREQDRSCEVNSFPPVLEIHGSLTVTEGGFIDITDKAVYVTDVDTPDKYLSIVLEAIPMTGQMIKVGSMGNSLLLEGELIPVEDFKRGKVRFVHGSGAMYKSSLRMRAVDGQLYSQTAQISIQVQPQDKLHLTTSKPLLAAKGMDTQLTTDVLDVTTRSRPEDVTFMVLDGPVHGSFVKTSTGDTTDSFTLADIRSGVIVYHHNGNESESIDLARLLVSDEYSQLTILLSARIQSQTSKIPVVLTNMGGQVFKGDVLQITPDVLDTLVQDSEDLRSRGAIYTLVPLADNPKHGEIMMIVPTPQEGPGNGWTDLGDGTMGARMFRFMQRDINEGRIFYKHTGNDVTADKFTFEVSDTASPPNILKDQSFDITVIEDDTEALSLPTLAPGVRLGMTVLENQIVPITAAHLAFNDLDTDPEDLIFKITSLLREDEGTIEHVDFPYSPVLQFTQADIDERHIIYRPPDAEIGTKEKEVSFTFVVTDGGEARQLSENKFTIHIIPVNNNPPYFVNPNPEVSLAEGGIFPLTSGLLEVIDLDTELDNLEITVTESPINGIIEKIQEGITAIVRSGDKFSYTDVMSSTFQYVHAGGIGSSEDKLSLSVSDGPHQTGNTIFFNVIKVDKSAPVMLPSASCQLNVTEGTSVEITREQMAFSDTENSDDEIQIYLAKYTTHGHFLVIDKSDSRRIHVGDSFTQDDINKGRVSFVADKEIGSKSVTELVYVNVTDSSCNILPSQILSVVITPVDNQAPVVSIGSYLKVEEGGEAVVQAEMMSVLDVDTPFSQMRFVVETMPTFGVLENRKPVKGSEMKIRQKSAESFPLKDLIDGQIYYVQSDHKNKEPAWDAFLFSVTDGTNESPLQRFNISIQLINDEAPLILTEQLFANEGKAVTLTNASMYVVDLDTLSEDLIFTVTQAPINGQLLKKEFFQDPIDTAYRLKEKSTFTYEDVLNELVLYKHDDGETNQDSVAFQLTDGDFTDTKTLNIIVGLINDETPRVTINRGLRVQAGSTTPIKSHDLKATDLDSEDSAIVYTIMKDPPAGSLMFDNGQLSYSLKALSPVKTFTQTDIDQGHIYYVHNMEEDKGNILFKFKLTDPEGNDLIDQDFFITVLEDRLPPQKVNNREFLVTEGKSEKLTTEFLSFTDADTEPGSLTYTILEGPDLGHLELVGQAGVPIVSFTQSDLAANTVTYIHTSPSELATDHFTFVVSDGTNEIVQSFYINVSPVDDAIPLLSNHGLRVQEGVRKLITEFDLKAVDQDTQEHQILFTVVEPPTHGTLDLLTGETHEAAVTFTMEDIYENRVSYQHDGSETSQDGFKFVVSDGTNKVFAMQQDQPAYRPVNSPQDFEITILPMDDGMPVIETNLGLQFLEFDGVRTGNLITSKELKATDEDTPPSDIIYIIKDPPTFGIVEYTTNLGLQISSFTQEDLNNGVIQYTLTQVSEDLQDSFEFDLMDQKPNVVPGNHFHIMWSEISLGQPIFNVTETQGVLQIPVIRRGNLKQYAIVKCEVRAGSALSRSDISRPGMQDFVATAGQVQFDNWQERQTCSIIINDDSLYEGSETFYVEISSPTFALLGNVRKAAINIYDEEDEPTIQFLTDVMQVNETDDYVMATIVRSGDVSDTVSVICATKSLTATGSSLKGLESGSDYISRGRTNAYRVVFPPGVTQANCDIKLIDDSVYESMEQFELELSDPSVPATLGTRTTTLVIISGPNDVSLIYFASDEFAFSEDSGQIELEVLREGSDLSHTSMVWCATRMSDIASATPGEDYVPSSTQLTFGPGETSQICHIVLLDDDFEPQLEGNETFVVFLSSAMGSSLDQPVAATVSIYDQHLDIPEMAFVQDSYIVDEKNKTVNATVIRQGDITLESSVICYTRQQTAQVMMDYNERTFTNNSRISFKAGEKSKPCIVGIVDDNEFEPDETFLLKLGQPLGEGDVVATVGGLSTATIVITNHDDVPKIQFEESAYSVHEPSVIDQVATVRVKVIRTGAVNETAEVRCSTRDGSAQSGLDYNPKSLVLHFEPGMREIDFPVDVLYNSAIEWHESFSVQLGPGDPSNSIFGSITMATITILDNEVSGSIVLPAPPMVASLLHYHDMEQGQKVNPSPGYPLICVTPCDPHYPSFPTTATLCEEGEINQTRMLYHWEVAMPPDDDGVVPMLVRVTDKTLFTSVNKKVLDSIYFRPFFQVRCVAQPLHENGNPGIPLKSHPVTIGHNNAICKSASLTSSSYPIYQAQSFLASLEYITPDKSDHPNTVHISIQIPHQDGMLPLISTHPLHNLRFLLSEPIYRQQHICSNIITAQERAPLLDQGFLGDTVNSKFANVGDAEEMPYGPGFDFPHQFDSTLRESQSLQLYRHLNLKSCVWQFDAWYHMTELIDMCGGRVVSDFQVKDKSDTHLTVRVPLYVSYVYATAPTGWGSLEHRTEMEFSFYYSTVLWKAGVETESHQGGKLQVVRIVIGDDGKLVLEFRTQAKFRGQYVLKHHTLPGMESRIIAPKSLAITFDLTLIWSQNTFDSPHQVWRASSQYNLKDYTGVYKVELVPCLVPATQGFVKTDPLPCAAQQVQRFEVPISFQQTNRPVPVIYSLNTDFQLSNNKKMFLLDPATPGMAIEDWDFNGAFSRGQKLYGRVLWSMDQDLKTAYKLMLEKVYLCTGKDGHIPTYDPAGDTYDEGPQFGCIQPSQKLLHRFLILDRGSPEVTTADFQHVPFNAQFASEDEQYAGLIHLPGVDGFVMDVDPLYKVDSGHQWYIQIVYTIGPSNIPAYRHRRSLLSSSLSSPKSLSTVNDDPGNFKAAPRMTVPHKSPQTSVSRQLRDRPIRNTAISHGEENDGSNNFDFSKVDDEPPKNGTNMKLLHLVSSTPNSSHSSSTLPVVAIVIPPVLTILILSIIIFLCIRRRRRRKLLAAAEKPPATMNNLLQAKTNPHKHARSLSDQEPIVRKDSRKNSRISENRSSVSSINKCNIIKPKDTNILSRQGVNVESGTEV